ncbi:MAG: DUF928 domain-containing protein [Elainellaceae cyanobacterium]
MTQSIQIKKFSGASRSIARRLPKRLASTIMLTVFGSTVLGLQLLPAYAQSSPSSPSSASIVFSAPPPPSDLGEPGGRSEAASRGCGINGELTGESIPSDQVGLTALASIVNTGEFDAVWGLTTADRPTFLFYVPQSLMSGTGKFIIEDETTQWTYSVTLAEQAGAQSGGQSGIVRISLPESAPSLALDTDYHWYFNIYCQPEQPPRFVHGWIRKTDVDPTLEAELAQASPAQQVELYAEHGIWYDALAIAADLYSTNSTDSTSTDSTWARLLQSVGLETVAEKPLIDCCQLASDQSQLPISTYDDQYIGRQ